MALNDRQHVEAVAIMRCLLDAVEHVDCDRAGKQAATQWLAENHPQPAVYMAAMRAQIDEAQR